VLRSHFKHSVELVDDNGEIVDQLAGVQDFMLARATYDAAVRRWPKARIRLCQEARIIEAAVSRIEQRGAAAFRCRDCCGGDPADTLWGYVF
jgi:hypothetical protein